MTLAPTMDTTFDAEPALRPPRFSTRLVRAGVGLGLFAELAFHGHALGLSALLLHLAVTVALRWTAGAELWSSAPSARRLWLMSGFFAALLALHDSDTLTFLNWVAWVATGLAALRAWSGGTRRWLDWTLVDWLVTPITTAVRSVPAAARVLREVVRVAEVLRLAAASGGPVVRAGLVVIPTLCVFLVLLMTADAVFSDFMHRAYEAAQLVPLRSMVAFTLFWSAAAVGSLGLLAIATARPAQALEPSSPKPIALGRFERLALLWSVTGLLALFDGLTARCALGATRCELPAGVTYAEYVHAGFGQLVAAACLVLAVVLVLSRHAPNPRDDVHQTFAATALVVATLPLVGSGIARLHLYEAAYGFSVQRVLAQASTLLIGAWLVWRSLTLWLAPRRFVPGAVALTLLSVVALNAMNLEAYVAEKNVERRAVTHTIDDAYLATLSADVLPAVRAARRVMPGDAPLAHIETSLTGSRCRDDSWPAWTLACWRGR